MKPLIMMLTILLTSSCSVEVPHDFNFKYRCRSWQLNTFDSTYYVRYEDFDTTFRFILTNREKEKIYKAMKDIDINSCRNINILQSKGWVQKKDNYIDVCIDSCRYEYEWGSHTLHPKGEMLDRMIYDIQEILSTRPEIAALPRETFYYPYVHPKP